MGMPSARFLDVLQKLSVTHRKRIEVELALWKAKRSILGFDCAQLAENIEAENALSTPDFARLLKNFAVQLGKKSGDISFWRIACVSHELLGPQVPASARPLQLGRAAKVKGYADHIGKNIPKSAASHHLAKNAGKSKPLPALVRQMRRTSLSAGRILWATFSRPPETDPLAGMPRDTDGVAICLGLGCSNDPAPFIVMQYEMSAASSPPLHKPTVADAGTYSFFRPSTDPSAHCGMTEPLKKNPRNLSGRPELVHSQISGKSLVFPYFLSV